MITTEQAKDYLKEDFYKETIPVSKAIKFAEHCINEYKESLKEHDGYYCPKCEKHINGIEVTFEEKCDFCGTKCI